MILQQNAKVQKYLNNKAPYVIIDGKRYYVRKALVNDPVLLEAFINEKIESQRPGDILEKALALRKQQLRPQTCSSYATMIRHFQKWLSENGNPEITVNVCEVYANDLTETLPASSKNRIQILGSLLKDKTGENPFARVKTKKTQSTGHKIYTKADRQKLLAAMDLETKTFVELIHWCFIRPGELKQLKREHIDLDGKMITIPASISKTKKTGTINIPPGVYKTLSDYLDSSEPGTHLFNLTLEAYRKRHEKYLRETNLAGKGYTLYSHKHTGAMECWRELGDVLQISKHCRHSNVATTQIYLRELSPEDCVGIRNWGV